MDVNVLVAWGWADHVDHKRVVTWIAAMKRRPEVTLLTSPLPQLGFVRVSVQRTGGLVTVKQAAEVLAGMLQSLGARLLFLPDDAPIASLPEWCKSARDTTDAHLCDLARAHQAMLATLDEGIPGGFLIRTVQEGA